MKLNDPVLELHFKNILDTFSAADGGVNFTLFKYYVELLDEEPDGYAKDELVKIIVRFSQLIEMTTKEMKKR